MCSSGWQSTRGARAGAPACRSVPAPRSEACLPKTALDRRAFPLTLFVDRPSDSEPAVPLGSWRRRLSGLADLGIAWAIDPHPHDQEIEEEAGRIADELGEIGAQSSERERR